jgi:hypothetical protein
MTCKHKGLYACLQMQLQLSVRSQERLLIYCIKANQFIKSAPKKKGLTLAQSSIACG